MLISDRWLIRRRHRCPHRQDSVPVKETESFLQCRNNRFVHIFTQHSVEILIVLIFHDISFLTILLEPFLRRNGIEHIGNGPRIKLSCFLE